MKIVIPGGSGQVGTVLARALQQEGHQVVVLSRQPARPRSSRLRAARHLPGSHPWRVVAWDAATLGPWQQEVDGSDVVINLAGRNVNCRYTAANREEILRSRVTTTQLVAEAISQARRPPAVWLQASTATVYAHRFDAPNDEQTGILGGGEPGAPASWDFSIHVAQSWERTFAEAQVPGTRRVALRSAMTMSPDPGGIFDTLLGLVRRGLGGRAGDGRQFISWIHHQDFVRAIHWLIQRDDIDGVVNLAAPNPLPNAEFMQALRSAAGIPIGLPATRWMLELGAIFLRTETELILKSRRVVPRRLLDSGFAFQFPHWPDAAQDLCRQRTGAVR